MAGNNEPSGSDPFDVITRLTMKASPCPFYFAAQPGLDCNGESNPGLEPKLIEPSEEDFEFESKIVEKVLPGQALVYCFFPAPEMEVTTITLEHELCRCNEIPDDQLKVVKIISKNQVCKIFIEMPIEQRNRLVQRSFSIMIEESSYKLFDCINPTIYCDLKDTVNEKSIERLVTTIAIYGYEDVFHVSESARTVTQLPHNFSDRVAKGNGFTIRYQIYIPFRLNYEKWIDGFTLKQLYPNLTA